MRWPCGRPDLVESAARRRKEPSDCCDVNAVPPAGIEGLDMQANGDPLTPNGAVGLGPLAVGNVKYKTEFGLFKG